LKNLKDRLQFLKDFLQELKSKDFSLLELEKKLEEGIKQAEEFSEEDPSSEEIELFEEISVIKFVKRVDAYEKFIDS